MIAAEKYDARFQKVLSERVQLNSDNFFLKKFSLKAAIIGRPAKCKLNIHLSILINEHFSSSFFLTQAPIILNEFNLIIRVSMDQNLEVFRYSFYSFYFLGVHKRKNQHFGA